MTTPRSHAPVDLRRSDGRSRFGLAGTSSHPEAKFGATGAVVGALVAIVLVGSLVWAAATGHAPPSQRPQIFGGSLVLDDYRPLTVIDLATGAVTVQLVGVNAQVGTTNYADVEAVPTTVGTMLVNRETGTFNMLGQDNYVFGPATSGISLGPLAGATGAIGLADGAATYIVRYAPRSTVSLVDAGTAQAGAAALTSGSHQPVPPLGFTELGGSVDGQPGGTTVNRAHLWLLEEAAHNCSVVRVAQSSRSAHGLSSTYVFSSPSPCRASALESSAGTVALALPGKVELFRSAGASTKVTSTTVRVGTARASEFLPVRGASGGLWYLARMPSGWSVFGVGPTGVVTGPLPLAPFTSGSDPAVPVYAGGLLYTMDQAQAGQPTLWTIRPRTGAMKPVRGVPTYPARSVTEQASFMGAQVLVDGPRVIFNNPESLLAVVLFTDGSHAPVIVNKSNAVVVSAAGPGDANVKARKHKPTPKPSSKAPPHPSDPIPTTTPTTVAQPLTQPVTEQVDCATTTEKPYEPQIRSISPADESALVTWSYHLLSEQDCLPNTWSVSVTPTAGGPTPRRPVQIVNGQQQLLFTGLVPGTTYNAVVTAYMNKQSTASTPVSFTTTAVGPGAPSGVKAVANGAGGWLVTWAPCTKGCEVAAHAWKIVGSSCGAGFVGQPPMLTVPGSATSVTVNAGNDLGLLGDSFQFSVEGVGSTGLVGAPVTDNRCSQAWQPPNPADLQLLAAGTPVGPSITADLNVVVATGASPAAAYGGDSVTFTYAVGGDSVGPTTSSTADVAGLGPNRSYQASVVVTPVGHPSAAVTVSSAQFGRALPWPSDLSMQAAGAIGANANTGTVVAGFHDLPPGPFEAHGTVTCGSEVLPVEGHLSGTQFLAPVNLDQIGGRCALGLTLRSLLTPDPYGVPSPALTTRFVIGTPPSYAFAAVADEKCQRSCGVLDLYVSYDGAGQPAGTDWLVSASGPPACTRATAVRAVAAFPVVLKWPISCSTPTVTVSWVYLGQPTSTTASPPSLPPAPTTTSTTSVITTTTSATATTSATTKTSATTTTLGKAPSSTVTATSIAPTSTTSKSVTPTSVTPTSVTPTSVTRRSGTPTSVPPTSVTPTPVTATTRAAPTTVAPTTLPAATTTVPAATTTIPITRASPSTTGAPTTTATLPTTSPTFPTTTTTSSTTTSTVPTTTTTLPTTTTTLPTTTTTLPTTTTTLPTTTSTAPTTTLPTTTVPASTTTNPCPVTTVVFGVTICENNTTTTATTTTLPTTTSTPPTTSPASTTSPAATTTVPSTTTTSPAETTVPPPTLNVSQAQCTPHTTECSGATALAAGAGRNGPGARPPSAPLALGLWTALAAALVGVCGGAIGWGLNRAPRSRLRRFLTLEASP